MKLLLLALLFASLELFLPRLPMAPWLKPGLANIVTMVWLYRFGYKDTLLLGLLRVWILSLFWGFSFFTSLVGLAGMLLSVTVMSIAMWGVRKGVVGLFTVGVLGAFSHNVGQLLLVTPLLGDLFSFENQLPFMIPASLVSGIITAYGASRLSGKREWFEVKEVPILEQQSSQKSTASSKVVSLFLLLLAVSLFFTKSVPLLVSLMFLLWGSASIVEKSVILPLKPVMRAWLFLLFIFLSFLPFDNSYRVSLAVMQVLRIVSWLIMTSLFRYFKFDILLFALLKKWFKSGAESLDAALIVVELFPALVDSSKLVRMTLWKWKIRGRLTALLEEVDSLVDRELTKEPEDK